MSNQAHYQNGLKRIAYLESKIESLQRLGKLDQVFVKVKALFHYSTSFVSYSYRWSFPTGI